MATEFPARPVPGLRGTVDLRGAHRPHPDEAADVVRGVEPRDRGRAVREGEEQVVGFADVRDDRDRREADRGRRRVTTRFSKIQWGDGLTVTPDTDDPTVIRVDGIGGSGATAWSAKRGLKARKAPQGLRVTLAGHRAPQAPRGLPAPRGLLAPLGRPARRATRATPGRRALPAQPGPTGPTGPAGAASPTDSLVWMPLTTTLPGGDDVLVYDADHSLIPTLIPL